MRYVEVPAPITLRDLHSKDQRPLKAQEIVDGKAVLVDVKPSSLHDFVLDHISPALKTFKEYKAGGRILRVLKEAESTRCDDQPVIAALEEGDWELLKRQLDSLQLLNGMNGYHGMQYLPFMEAIDSAKTEKPKAALKAVASPDLQGA